MSDVKINKFEVNGQSIEIDDSKLTELLSELKDELYENLNNESDFHLGYELSASGTYSPNEQYNSSGILYVNSNLKYETNYQGNIFCYDSTSTYLGKVASGSDLLEGTKFVRLNWKATIDPPYFKVVKSYQVFEDISSDKINGDDLLNTELTVSGWTSFNADWRTSQKIFLDEGKNYKCNVSANYYYYDETFTFLSRINTAANTVFNRSSCEGARYMRTNAPIGNPIEIYEFDRFGMAERYRLFNGVAKMALSGGSSLNTNADEKIKENIDVTLPDISSSVEIRFKTNQSFYKQSESLELFRVRNFVLIKISPIEVDDSYYCDKCETNISVNMGGVVKTIPLRLNNYGKDLFSIRLKYPIVNVGVGGLTEMVTPMPTEYQGMYLMKSSDTFAIMNGDDTIFKSWQTSEYADVDAFVEAIKLDTDVTDIFDIKKYGCEGISFSQINNFDKVGLCKEHTEILYSASPTGNVYWDSYPTFLRTSDVGYEHVLKINYKVIDGVIKESQVSVDGMFVRFAEQNISIEDLTLLANLNGIISEVVNVSVLPYKPIRTPMLSMQHYVHVNENLENQSMVTTTMRQYDILAYLKKKGFVGQNFDECMASIRGSNAIDKPTYCLTFDDRQKSIWTNTEIRDVFNQFRAKPTLIYVFNAEDFSDTTPPSYALSTDEYKAAKASGLDIISHGFCVSSDRLSYAQFYQGFLRNKEAWMRWYGEDVQSYNPHGAEITDYQYYLIKHMGFHSISSGSAYLGWFCECGTNIDVQYKRVGWMDSEQNWATVKRNIDEWVM